jgi:pSer/pThr/pTyr-binding forkhead associated (FHA) protein
MSFRRTVNDCTPAGSGSKMRDGLVIVLVAAAIAAVAYLWSSRFRSTSPGGRSEPASSRDFEAPAGAAGRPRTLAVLEFEGEPGLVDVIRPEVVIGRHSEDDIQVRDVRISRHHARLVAHRDGGFEIHNLTAVRSEPNPMQVNGVIREHARLQDGDIVSLGGVNFTLWLKAA